jgi:hypothetical protein
LTVWFTDEAIAAWQSAPRTTRGGQPWYSALAIQTALTLRAVFRLALHQTEGLIGSVIRLLGPSLAVPDHSTLSRRAETLDVPQPQSSTGSGAEPLHLLVDSTGLKLCGAAEWLVEKHGTKTRRSWRKLHIGMDADTSEIVASALTTNDVDDASQLAPLLDQIERSLVSFTGDGAYDQDSVYRVIIDHDPDAVVVVPPRATPVLSETAGTAPTQRDHHLQCIASKGRIGWQKVSGYTLTQPGGGRHRTLQTADRGRSALSYGRASYHRDWCRHPCLEPHAGAGTPDLRPHCLSFNGDEVAATCQPIRATTQRRVAA